MVEITKGLTFQVREGANSGTADEIDLLTVVVIDRMTDVCSFLYWQSSRALAGSESLIG